ncbi:MAG: ExeM/NucH family extracellular endonuclease [Pseudomonadota bacterium]
MATLFQESFETDGNGSRYTTSVPEFTDGAGDFFVRTDGTAIGGFYSVTGQDGASYFAAMDLDGEGGPTTVSVEFTGIDISGATNLTFSGLFAEDDDGSAQDWDADSLVTVEAQIDTGGYVPVLQFASQGATNTEPGLDTDFDGIADGTALTSVFAAYGAGISGTGTTLDLRITIAGLDAGDEDIAFDNIEVTGDLAGATEVTVLDEAFDDASAFSTSTPFFSDGAFDYFGISDGLGGGDFGGAAPTGLKPYTGTTGSFLTGMDLDGEGASLPVTATWSGLDISGLTDLTFSGDFGEFFDDPGDIDASDFIRVTASIDGGPTQTVLEFRGADFSSTGGPFNGVFRQDTDFDGTGDGAALGDALQGFVAGISGTGSTLDLTLEVQVEAGDEDFAVDNFKIVGTSGGAVEPAVIARSGDGLSVAEDGETTDSFTLELTTTPASAVTVEVSASDGQSLVSMDGVSFAATVAVDLTDTTPATVFVQAVDDAVNEADPHLGAVSFAVTSADGDYDGLAVGDLSVSIADDDVTVTLISAIQGTGDPSPLDGQTVTVEAVVTGVITRDDGSIEGYFLQEEDADWDADTATSEGLFVFSRFDTVDVAVGDKVRATGEVAEFGGLTQLGSGTVVETLDTGVALPTATQITLGMRDDFEAYEGMRVTLAPGSDDPLTVVTNFNLDRFGQVDVAEGNLIQPTQLFDAQTEAAEVAALRAANEAGRLTIDDFSTASNPDINPYTLIDSGDGTPLEIGDPLGEDGPTLRLGTEVGDITGVLDERFGGYRLQTDGPLQSISDAGDRPTEVPEVGGDLTVVSFNVLNYFTTLSGGTGPTGDLGVRGARSEEDLARQTEKLVLAFREIDADIVAIQEIENNGFGPDSAIAALVDALNAAEGSDVYAFVDPGTDFVGTDAITAGLIYKTDAVSVAGSAIRVFDEASAEVTFDIADGLQQELLSSGFYTDAEDFPVGDFQRNRPAVAATFEDAEGNELTVVANHFKSKGPSGLSDLVDDAQTAGLDAAAIQALIDDPNYDQDDGQAFWNQARADASAELTEWLETGPTGATDTSNTLILGDLNAYAKEDPVQTIEADGYTDLAEEFIGDDAYSFVFDGQRGTLDYGLASAGLLDNITGVAEWHINADEPDLLNYSSQFNDPFFYNADVFAASDHDPLIIGIEFDDPVVTAVARLDFVERFFRDQVKYSLDGEVVDTERLRLLQNHIDVDAAGITIGADDGLRFSPEFITTAGKGIGVYSVIGDFGWRSWRDAREVEEKETLSFHLEDTGTLGDALEVEFEFATVRGSGEVELSFFNDGTLIDTVVSQIADGAVSASVEDGFDEVSIGATEDLSFTLSAVEFVRIEDEFSFV